MNPHFYYDPVTGLPGAIRASDVEFLATADPAKIQFLETLESYGYTRERAEALWDAAVNAADRAASLSASDAAGVADLLAKFVEDSKQKAIAHSPKLAKKREFEASTLEDVAIYIPVGEPVQSVVDGAVKQRAVRLTRDNRHQLLAFRQQQQRQQRKAHRKGRGR